MTTVRKVVGAVARFLHALKVMGGRYEGRDDGTTASIVCTLCDDKVVWSGPSGSLDDEIVEAMALIARTEARRRGDWQL